MSLSAEGLRVEAGRTGFRPEVLEKVHWLLDVLDTMRGHPYLKSRLALKGGTALNLFVFDVPRLSVDIDLNYVGALDRETMLAERPIFERAINAVARRLGLKLRRASDDAHALSVLRTERRITTSQNWGFRCEKYPFLGRCPILSE